jgi:hypothetical protein
VVHFAYRCQEQISSHTCPRELFIHGHPGYLDGRILLIVIIINAILLLNKLDLYCVCNQGEEAGKGGFARCKGMFC